MAVTDRDEIARLAEAVDDLTRAIARLETAFPRNDLGAPDLDGHRQSHIERIKRAQEVRGYQTALTQKILVGGAAAVITLLGTGFWKTIAENVKGAI